MPLPASMSRLRAPSVGVLLLACALAITGCGQQEGQIAYSQDFPKPEGATAKADPGSVLSRDEQRRKDIEESRQEASRGKGKRRRS